MTPTYTAFTGERRLATGPLLDIAHIVRETGDPVLIYDDATGKSLDLDLRGSDADLAARYGSPAPAAAEEPRGRGRPKLGVVAREVTLLPRHWDWLAAQSGGASVALRKLIDEARKREDGWAGAKRERRQAQDAAYYFMSAMAGDYAGFEAAIRALYADDRATFLERTEDWPGDIRDHARKLADIRA